MDKDRAEDGADSTVDAPGFEERRVARRVPTSREAVFESLTVKGPSRDGMVVDLSHDGLRIHTRTPAAVGERLLIEVDPKPHDPSSTRIKTEGRVVWVKKTGRDEFAMGIRMRKGAHAPGEPIEANMAVLGGEGAPGVVSEPAPRKRAVNEAALSAQSPTTVKDDKRRRRRVLLALCLGVLCAIILFLLLGRELQDALFHGRLGPSSPPLPVAATPEPLPDFVPPADALTEPAGPEHPLVSQVDDPVVRDGEPRSPREPREVSGSNGNDPMEAVNPFDATAGDGTVNGRVFASLEPVSSEGDPEEEGQPGPLLAAIEPSDEQGNPAREGEQRETNAPQPSDESSGQANAVSQTVPAEIAAMLTGNKDRIPGQGMAILVDKAAYTMVLVKDGQPIRWFPVGLGKDNSTPEGQFVIANKIANPDWFDHGRTVKAGDPENPLGASWMGLGNGQPMSVGIHPTNDTGSIGQSASRGCIRMRPGDAEAVFHLCPVGTPVNIFGTESAPTTAPQEQS